MSIRPGLFVAIEGVDGAGKSCSAAELSEMLATFGVPVLLVSRCTAPASADGYAAAHLAELARLIWDYPAGARTSQLGAWHWRHLLAAWFHGVGELVLRPAIAAGRCVVADSWHYKYAARFAVTADLATSLGLFDGVPEPDRVLWLDPALEACVARRSATRATERGEWLDLDGQADGFLVYQQRVRASYQEMRTDGRWQVCPDSDRERVRAWLRGHATEIAGQFW